MSSKRECSQDQKKANRKPSPWLTIDQICEELGVVRATYDRWRANGQAAPAKRLPGGQIRTRVEDLQAWLDNLPDANDSRPDALTRDNGDARSFEHRSCEAETAS